MKVRTVEELRKILDTLPADMEVHVQQGRYAHNHITSAQLKSNWRDNVDVLVLS